MTPGNSGTTGIITQVRTTSTRLPGKVLIHAGGRTMLEHHLDRLAATGVPVFVATTDNDADDPVQDLAAERGLGVHRGSEHDVLGRFAGCIREFDLDTVVRVTSDCPLIDADVIDRAVAAYRAAADPWLYCSNGLLRTWPRGFDVEVFSATALLDADEHATEPSHREHVTPYLYTNGSGRIDLLNLAREDDASAYRVTLDTAADLELISILIEEYDAASLDAEQIIGILRDHPHLVAINAAVEQKKLGD